MDFDRSSAGLSLNWWEDPSHDALKKVAAANPQVMKSAVPGEDDVAFLPDEQFAYVGHDKVADAKVRLFPTNTDASTLVSAELFKTARDCFSDPTVQRIEMRFKLAADWHGLDDLDLGIPLQKTAAPVQDMKYALTIATGAGAGNYYAMPTPDHVKLAADYFETYSGDLTPAYRRTFARNVDARARDFGLQLEKGAQMSTYTSSQLRPDAGSYVRLSRLPWLTGQEKGASADSFVEMLQEQFRAEDAYQKLASIMDDGKISLDDAVASLAYIDKEAGLKEAGQLAELAHVEKVASGFSQEVDGEMVTGEMLQKIDTTKVAAYFGDAMAKVFAERPAETFSVMPEEQQQIIKAIAYGNA